MNKDALQKSIVLNGAVGSGKSLLARELSKRLDYPIISTDTFRFLPSIEDFEKWDRMSPEDKDEQFKKLREDFFHTNQMPLDEVEFQLKSLRALLPNVRNYQQMKFNGYISQYVNIHYGPIAWHCYHKQFENAMLQDIIDTLDTPVILDLGGGVGISLDKDYQKLRERITPEDERKLERHFSRIDTIGFDKTKALLSYFANVVCLQLPKDFSNFNKASQDRLNKVFISTHQYEETATQSISVKDLFDKNGQPVWANVFKTADEVISKCSSITPPKSSQSDLKNELHEIDTLIEKNHVSINKAGNGKQ